MPAFCLQNGVVTWSILGASVRLFECLIMGIVTLFLNDSATPQQPTLVFAAVVLNALVVVLALALGGLLSMHYAALAIVQRVRRAAANRSSQEERRREVRLATRYGRPLYIALLVADFLTIAVSTATVVWIFPIVEVCSGRILPHP